MQTFLPYPSFMESAKVLDYRRLGKQRVEVKQILAALEGTTKAWKNHPCTKQWSEYETALRAYGDYILAEWINRGYKNNMLPFLSGYDSYYIYLTDLSQIELPPWLGNEDFHRSHRSNLLRKNPEYYSKFFKDVDNNLPYVWPV